MSYLYYDYIINKLTSFENKGAIYGADEIWVEKPTPDGTILYSVITPAICFFGFIANTLSCMVLCRKELGCSCFTYLAVLSFADLINCIITFLSGLARGALWHITGWAEYDALISLPLGGVFSTVSVVAVVAVTFDRVTYLSSSCGKTKPKFCNPRVARKVMLITFIVAILFNIPYCFIFEVDQHGVLHTTDFFFSTFYGVHNWCKFTLFSIIPAILLLAGNCILIGNVHATLHKKKMICKKLNKRCDNGRDKVRLTMALVAIICMFFIGDIPACIASRKTAVTILYGGNLSSAEKSNTLEILRQFATVLYALNISINFLFYMYLCPKFKRSLKALLRGKHARKTTNVQVNVFVLSGKDVVEKEYIHRKTEKLLDILKKNEDCVSRASVSSCTSNQSSSSQEPCGGNTSIIHTII